MDPTEKGRSSTRTTWKARKLTCLFCCEISHGPNVQARTGQTKQKCQHQPNRIPKRTDLELRPLVSSGAYICTFIYTAVSKTNTEERHVLSLSVEMYCKLDGTEGGSDWRAVAGGQFHPAISACVPNRKRRRCLEWTIISTWTAQSARRCSESGPMHLSMRMVYKTQLATTLSGVSFGLPAHLRIFDQVASEPSHAKTTCLHIHCFYVRVLRCFRRNPPESVYRPPTILSRFRRENFE